MGFQFFIRVSANYFYSPLLFIYANGFLLLTVDYVVLLIYPKNSWPNDGFVHTTPLFPGENVRQLAGTTKRWLWNAGLQAGHTGEVPASSACHRRDCSHELILLTEEGTQNNTLSHKNARLLILLLGSSMKEQENSSVTCLCDEMKYGYSQIGKEIRNILNKALKIFNTFPN